MQKPLVTMGTELKIDGNKVTVESIHKGYVIANDKKGASKVFSFEKVEHALTN